MTKHRLEELQELSLPAIGHPELVRLARMCSPNQTLKLARMARWPKRQVEAARYLALLRRDHPGKVFDDFLRSVEQARPTDVVTGCNKEQTMTAVNERLGRALALITDPQKKFKLMLEHGLRDEAGQYLEDLVENQTAFFWFDNHDANYFVCLVVHQGPNLDRRQDQNPTTEELYLQPAEIQKLLDWPSERLNKLLCRVLEKTVARKVEDGEYWQVLGTTSLARTLWNGIPQTLFHQCERWQLLWHFRKGEFGTSYQWFFLSGYWKSDSRDQLVENSSLLNRVVDRMLELGLEMSQIRKEFLDWLRDERHHGFWPCIIYAVAGAKCFEKNDEERYQALRPYLTSCWESLERGYQNQITLSVFLKFGAVGLYRSDDEEFFRQKLVELLSLGRVAWVYQTLRLARYNLLRQSWSYAVTDKQRQREDLEAMAELAHNAFDLAVEEKRYGIAAALSQHFDCVATNKLLEALYCELEPELEQALGSPLSGLVDRREVGQLVETGSLYFSEKVDEQLDAKIASIRERRDRELQTRIKTRQQQIAETMDLAIVLKQPIRLEFAEYLELTN